jgi:hypothetical protein
MIIWQERKEPLQEELKAATDTLFKKLDTQINQDAELRRMLTTPMGEIPQYEYLYTEESIYLETHPLISLLKYLGSEKLGKLFFSIAGTKFEGFVTYVEKGKDIIGIKIASFYDDTKKANVVLARDLFKLLSSELPRRRIITWKANKNNPANKLYQDILVKKFSGIGTFEESGTSIVYTIKGGLA